MNDGCDQSQETRTVKYKSNYPGDEVNNIENNKERVSHVDFLSITHFSFFLKKLIKNFGWNLNISQVWLVKIKR